jgi:tetratricopeptide (TPR) repeat protein
MHNAAFRTGLLVGLLGALGVLCTTLPAVAQESGLTEAKDKAKAAPTSPEASLSYGRALRRAGKEGDALSELRRGAAFAKGNDAVRIDWEIARTHIAKRDFTPAMATCRGMKKLPNGAHASHACAAEAHLLWRRGTEASSELAEIAKLGNTPGDVQVAVKIIEARIRELESKDADAEAAYREAIKLAPTSVEAHVLLGSMLHRIGKDGLPFLKKAVELDSHDPVAQLELGRAQKVGSAEAIAAFERATTERPTFTEAFRALTEAYLAANRVADAKKTATATLKFAPNDVFAHIAEGRVALAESRYDDAIKEGEAAFKLMPNEGQTKLLVADAYAKKGEIDLALENYKKANGLDPLSPIPLLNATNACIAAGRLTSAKAYGRRATLDFPSYGPAWVALGDALAADKEPGDARKAYETSKKLSHVDTAAVDAKLAKLR